MLHTMVGEDESHASSSKVSRHEATCCLPLQCWGLDTLNSGLKAAWVCVPDGGKVPHSLL